MEEPRHGYNIKKKLEENFDVCTTINNNTLYSLLKKYEKAGVILKTKEYSSDGPSRNIYSITGKGKKYFVEILWDVTESVVKNRDEFMMRIYYFHFINSFLRKKILDLREQFLKNAIQRMTGVSDEQNTLFIPKNPYLIGYYNNLLKEELYLIEQMRNKADTPCLINEDGNLI